ncbi:serine/threonine-protein kinase [Sorangium sp. So ce131]|uniref:serine/threonine-protein kinase n=1 Tax=Sorangium sp. So ce131 TaxID=3133282 RepID=UPI003F5FA1B4
MGIEEELAQQRVGTWIGPWAVERVLGVGGMASVFYCRRADGCVAAVKLLHPELASIDEVRKRFLREGPIGIALAALAPICEGLPQVLEAGATQDGAVYMAMEVLEGETVWDRMARHGTLPIGQVIALAERVLEVLALAHDHGIIHRDLKPENLHIGNDGRVRVLDFGLARVLDPLLEDAAGMPEMTKTSTGVSIGTDDYMAPEQALGLIREIDGRTDLFGLGATMFRLLAGRTIHGNLEDARLLIAAATEKAPPLALHAPTAPPGLCAVVDRALAFDKQQRYPDARTMRADLGAVRAGYDPPYATAAARGRA